MLSSIIPCPSIVAAKSEVKKVLESLGDYKKRGIYEHFSPKEKANVVKYAAEHGMTASY